MALSVGRMRGGGYEYLYLPSPLLTKEGKGGAGIVNKLLNTYKDDRKGERVLRGFGPARRGGRNACGVSPPRAEVLLFRQKDPKPLAPGRGPSGAFAPVPKGLGCGTRFAQTVLAPQLDFGTAAQPRPQAPGNGAMRWRG